MLEACEARVTAVVPGIDRGCTMVTPEMREKLVDDAFAMRVVDAGDDVPELPGPSQKARESSALNFWEWCCRHLESAVSEGVG